MSRPIHKAPRAWVDADRVRIGVRGPFGDVISLIGELPKAASVPGTPIIIPPRDKCGRCGQSVAAVGA